MYSQQVKLVYSLKLYMKMKLSSGSLPHTVHLWPVFIIKRKFENPKNTAHSNYTL